MMKSAVNVFEVLDCSLRDGGYYTDWDFSKADVEAYLKSVSRLPISIVEIGYRSFARPDYRGEFFYLTPESLVRYKSFLRPDQQVAFMLDAKDCDPTTIAELCQPLVGVADIVRFAVAPAHLELVKQCARSIRPLGFKIAFNIMYMSKYQNDISKISAIFDAGDLFDFVALVDSYGGCYPDNVKNCFIELSKILPEKTLGYHGHDNMCLAMANTLAAIDGGATLVDSTFSGMGRGAGNLRTEAILIHKARIGNISIDYEALSSAVRPFEVMRREYEWGTNLPYMISGAYDLPQKDVMDWIGKNRYSVLSIIRALTQSQSVLDQTSYPSLAAQPPAKHVIVIGGGASVERHLEAINNAVFKLGAVTVFSSSRHVHLASSIAGRKLMCMAGHDISKLGIDAELSKLEAIVVPTPPRVDGSVPTGTSNRIMQAQPYASSSHDPMGPVSDTGPLALALGAVRDLKASHCWLAGFDGYENANTAQQELSQEVQDTLDKFQADSATATVRSITPTRYRVPMMSVYGIVSDEARID